MPRRRLAIREACFAVRSSSCRRKSNNTKSFPAPCILWNASPDAESVSVVIFYRGWPADRPIVKLWHILSVRRLSFRNVRGIFNIGCLRWWRTLVRQVERAALSAG